MQKSVVFKCSEQEIINLIQEHIGGNFDSIVAAEELGNQDWVVDVGNADDYDEETVKGYLSGEYHYCTQSLLNTLCSKGVLAAGEYIIDCTW